MKKPYDREIRSSLFAWSDEMMMVNYIPKSNKSVLLVSTEHTQPEISDREDKKSDIILD